MDDQTTFAICVRKVNNEVQHVGFALPEPSDEKSTKQETILNVSEQLEEKFRQLSSKWTSTSIGFFEVIPFLSILGRAAADRDLSTTTLKYVEEKSIKKEEKELEEGKEERFTLPSREFYIVAKKLSKSIQFLNAANIVKRSSIGSLIAEYEAFFSHFLFGLAQFSPSIFLEKDKQISIDKLDGFDSISDFKESIIRERIESIMQQSSHLELLVWVGKKFKVNLTSNKVLVAEFVEICQRRHILIHNGGIVNERYLRICKEAGCELSKLPKLDEEIEISVKYLRRATARVYQMGFFTLQIVWQKILPEQTRVSDTMVLNASHAFLEHNLTKMTCRLCDFSLKGKNSPNMKDKAYLTINKAQSILFDESIPASEKTEKIEAVLSKNDWSVKTTLIEIALDCLRLNHDKVFINLEKAVSEGLSYDDIYNWNIFKNFREHDCFEETVQELFFKGN